jgi:hypothetical protein
MSSSRQFVPRGELDPDRDLGVAAALFLVGALVPVLVALLADDVLSLYLTGLAGPAVAAGVFGFCLWLVVEWRNLDRPNVAVASVLVPAALFTLSTAIGMTVGFEGFPRLVHESPPPSPVGALFQYFGAFALAGLAAVACSRTLQRAGHDPDVRRVAVGAAAVLLVAVAVVGSANHAAASGATVTAVEPGTDRFYDPQVNVTVEGASAEMRVTVVDPNGGSVTKRVTRGATGDGRETVGFRVVDVAAPAAGSLTKTSGTYRVRVTTLAGVTVDTARYTADPGLDVAVVETAAARGPSDWNRSSRGSEHDLRVGVAVENRGVFYTEPTVRVGAPAEASVGYEDATLAPGETDVLVVGIPEADAERWRAAGVETVTVRLWPSPYADEPTATVEVPLPPPEA